MTTITFNTLAYSKTLRAAGFSETQAEALANAQNNAFAEMVQTSQLATKSDITRLEKQMAEMETRLVKSFHNALFGFTGVIIASVAVAVAILK